MDKGLVKIALICPSFFGYQDSILKELKKQSHTVQLFDDRPSNSVSMKICIRLKLNFLIKRALLIHKKKITNQVIKFSPDKVLIVSPEVFDVNCLELIHKENSKLQSILYMWDSFSNKPNARHFIPIVTKCFSFDLKDCAGSNNIYHQPLFFEETFRTQGSNIKPNKLLFVGTFHKSRALLLDYIKMYNNFIYTHIYVQSLLVKFVRVMSLFPNAQRMIMLFSKSKTYPLSKTETATLIFESEVVLDFQHRNQSGLTCRTFESLAGGCRLVTTNLEIIKYDFYDPRYIKVIGNKRVEDLTAFLKLKVEESDHKLFLDKLDKYSLENWVKRIIEVD